MAKLEDVVKARSTDNLPYRQRLRLIVNSDHNKGQHWPGNGALLLPCPYKRISRFNALGTAQKIMHE